MGEGDEVVTVGRSLQKLPDVPFFATLASHSKK